MKYPGHFARTLLFLNTTVCLDPTGLLPFLIRKISTGTKLIIPAYMPEHHFRHLFNSAIVSAMPLWVQILPATMLILYAKSCSMMPSWKNPSKPTLYHPDSENHETEKENSLTLVATSERMQSGVCRYSIQIQKRL